MVRDADARDSGSPGPDEDQGGLNLGDVIGFFFESLWLILGSVVVMALVAEVYLYFATPIYKVDAMIQVESENPGMRGLEGMDAMDPVMSKKSGNNTEIELLKSRMILGRVVENLGLGIIAKPRYVPWVGAGIARHHKGDNRLASPWFGLGQYAWGGESIKIESLTVPPHFINTPLTLIAEGDQGYSLLDQNRKLILKGHVNEPVKVVNEDDQTFQVFVSKLVAQPGTEFKVVRQSELSATATLGSQITIKERGKGTEMIEITLKNPDPQLAKASLNELANVYLRQNVERRSEEAQKRLEFVQTQLPSLKTQLDTAESNFNNYRQSHGSVDLDLETGHLLQEEVEYEKELRLLQVKKDELAQRFTPAHPQMVALATEMAQIKASLDGLNKQVTTLPETQQDILRFKRDVEVNTELYTHLLNNSQELRISKAGSIGNVRIIDPAVLPQATYLPKFLVIRLAAPLVGIILGLVMNFARRSLRSEIEDPDLIEKLVGIPVYATVPESKEINDYNKSQLFSLSSDKSAIKKEPLLAEEFSDSLSIESLRSLRTTLSFAMLEAKNHSILITGPAPGVGKSFISANLAAVLAQTGKKTLLIDADMRKGHLNHYFGRGRENGLSELLAGTLSFASLDRSTLTENLDFISTGVLPPNPSELLMQQSFQDLLTDAHHHYDIVIVDSPPVLAATDSVIIGKWAGATLLVLRSGQHPARQIKDTVKRLQHSGINLKGVVFNGMPLSNSRYGYGYKYGYGYYNYGRYAYTYSYKDKAGQGKGALGSLVGAIKKVIKG